MLCRSQLAAGRGGAQAGWKAADQRGNQEHRPIPVPCCGFAMDVPLALQWTPASQFATQKPSAAEACCEHHTLWHSRARCHAGTSEGCSRRHQLTAEDVQDGERPGLKTYENQETWTSSEVLSSFSSLTSPKGAQSGNPSWFSTHSSQVFKNMLGCCKFNAVTVQGKVSRLCAALMPCYAVFNSDQLISQLISQPHPRGDHTWEKQIACKSQTFFAYPSIYPI